MRYAVSLVLLVLLLTGCPSWIDGGSRVKFGLEDRNLYVSSTEGDILYGAFGLYATEIDSVYCVNSCTPSANGVIYLDLPLGKWGKRVTLGKAQAEILGGRASVVIEGEVSALEVALVQD